MPNLDGKTTGRLESQGHVKTTVRQVAAPAPEVEVHIPAETVEKAASESCCTTRCALMWTLRGVLGALTVTGVVVVGYYLIPDQ